MLEGLLLAQLFNLNAETKKQSRLLNKYSNSAFEWMMLYCAVGVVMWPIRVTRMVWKQSKFISVFFAAMVVLFAVSVPVLFLVLSFGFSVVMFFIERDKMEKHFDGLPEDGPRKKPEPILTVGANGKKKVPVHQVIYEVDASTGEILRVINK